MSLRIIISGIFTENKVLLDFLIPIRTVSVIIIAAISEFFFAFVF